MRAALIWIVLRCALQKLKINGGLSDRSILHTAKKKTQHLVERSRLVEPQVDNLGSLNLLD